MKSNRWALIQLLTLVLLAGCGSTSKIVSNQEYQGKLARPEQIVIYDFTPANTSTLNSPQQIKMAKEIGVEIAAGLTEEIRNMGLPAVRGRTARPLKINDIVFKGYILSLDEGDAEERIAIGFGEGASELKVKMEGYQMTAKGLRRLGSGTDDAGGSSNPGAALGVAGAVATGNPAGLIVSTGMKIYGESTGSSKVKGRAEQIVQDIVNKLRPKFREQGWI